MDNRLAALFYIGIIIPTIITITVFVGFLLCLYRRSLRRKVTKLSRRALPATPSSLSQRRTTIRSLEKFDKCSQHSADSAIDIGETSLDEKLGTGETILDATQLGRSNHSYENEGMQMTTEADIHQGRGNGTLRKGYYPSHEKLNEEIHSQVKIYEKMSDVQRVALQLQQKSESANRHLAAAAMQKLQLDEKVTNRYTSTSKLVPGACVSNNNQLSGPSNYASYSPSWYNKDGAEQKANLYKSQYSPSTASWQPNIAASCSSNTDNYSSMESSQV